MTLSPMRAFVLGLAVVAGLAGLAAAGLWGFGQAARQEAAKEEAAREAAIAACNAEALAQLDLPAGAAAWPAPFPRVEVTTDGSRFSVNTHMDVGLPADRWMVDCTVVRGRVTAQLYREGDSG
jgi:hypothetical protein